MHIYSIPLWVSFVYKCNPELFLFFQLVITVHFGSVVSMPIENIKELQNETNRTAITTTEVASTENNFIATEFLVTASLEIENITLLTTMTQSPLDGFRNTEHDYFTELFPDIASTINGDEETTSIPETTDPSSNTTGKDSTRHAYNKTPDLQEFNLTSSEAYFKDSITVTIAPLLQVASGATVQENILLPYTEITESSSTTETTAYTEATLTTLPNNGVDTDMNVETETSDISTLYGFTPEYSETQKASTVYTYEETTYLQELNSASPEPHFNDSIPVTVGAEVSTTPIVRGDLSSDYNEATESSPRTSTTTDTEVTEGILTTLATDGVNTHITIQTEASDTSTLYISTVEFSDQSDETTTFLPSTPETDSTTKMASKTFPAETRDTMIDETTHRKETIGTTIIIPLDVDYTSDDFIGDIKAIQTTERNLFDGNRLILDITEDVTPESSEIIELTISKDVSNKYQIKNTIDPEEYSSITDNVEVMTLSSMLTTDSYETTTNIYDNYVTEAVLEGITTFNEPRFNTPQNNENSTGIKYGYGQTTLYTSKPQILHTHTVNLDNFDMNKLASSGKYSTINMLYTSKPLILQPGYGSSTEIYVQINNSNNVGKASTKSTQKHVQKDEKKNLPKVNNLLFPTEIPQLCRKWSQKVFEFLEQTYNKVDNILHFIWPRYHIIKLKKFCNPRRVKSIRIHL